MRVNLWTSLVFLWLLLELCSGEEECLFSRIWCYECESDTDKRCADPFNTTAHPDYLPSLVNCQGCCVKIVMNKNTPYQSVRRTCTSNIQINLFMVDHVCMEESDGQGHMCFCESDGCNKTSTIAFSPIIALMALFLIISTIGTSHNLKL